MDQLMHHFDIEVANSSTLDLFVEELPQQMQLVTPGNCLATGSTACCTGGSTVGSIFTIGSILSTGK